LNINKIIFFQAKNQGYLQVSVTHYTSQIFVKEDYLHSALLLQIISIRSDEKMFATHFVENGQILLTQLRKQLPSVHEQINIKGRKGKVIEVQKVDEKNAYVKVLMEQAKPKTTIQVQENQKKR